MYNTANQSGLALLFSFRYDFPTEWSAFVNGSGDFAFTLRKDYFPYMAQNGDKLAQKTPAVPANLSSDLNGASGASNLTFPADDLKLNPRF